MALKLLRTQSPGRQLTSDVVITVGILTGLCGILQIGFELLPSLRRETVAFTYSSMVKETLWYRPWN